MKEKLENKYEITKTIRLGLTLKQSEKKHQTHTHMKDLVEKSEEKIKKNILPQDEFDEKCTVQKVACTFEKIKKFYNGWEQVFERTDQLALSKEFYKRIAKKALFDPFGKPSHQREKKKIKQPQPSNIKLSSLKTQYQEKERSECEYILDYWRQCVEKINTSIHNFSSVLQQYQDALHANNLAHKKPHLADFRKMFLSIANQCNEILIPLNNRSINFPSIDNLNNNDENNQKIISFYSEKEMEQRIQLAENITALKDLFKKHGGNVYWGRVTLNRYTAEQKPQKHTKKDENPIDKRIEELKLIEIIEKLQGKSSYEIRDHFLKITGKLEKISNEQHSIVERVQMYKATPIPASVQFALAEYLKKHPRLEKYPELKKKEILTLFREIGRPIDINTEYKSDPQNFNVCNYPLKQAFDYAWENLARAMYHPQMECNQEQCKEYLKKYDVNTQGTSFSLYAGLLFIRENLATLEYSKPNKPKEHIKNIRDTFEKIEKELQGHRKYKECIKHKDDILGWINKLPQQQPKQGSKEYTTYQTAKQKLGLIRGGCKNEIKKYRTLTDTFKCLSQKYGKAFAELRDKLREQHELNKITHTGIIVEQRAANNTDRYALLMPVDAEKLFGAISETKQKNNDLKAYYVKSLTSKSLIKFIKNKGTYENFHIKDFHIGDKKINHKDIQQHWGEYQKEEVLLSYLKECLHNSRMSTEQKWEEFKFDFSRCSTYQDIEKEVDQKGHILKEGAISKQKIEDIVNNEKGLLLPFVNQDITSEKREYKNQFSKDWNFMFEEHNNFRIHPEFQIIYRHPTPGYPIGKRHSRFQMVAQLLCEIVPKDQEYTNKKAQLKLFNDQDKLKEHIENFNQSTSKSDYVIFGIDRGLKQLATVCVLNSKGQIQGGFEIYTRKFNNTKKQWEHSLLEKRNILDLSNLRVETTVQCEKGLGEKVLVDLSTIRVKDEHGAYTKDNQQKIKLKQLSYLRTLQYQMQTNEEKVLDFFKQCKTDKDIHKHIKDNIGNIITPYKEGKRYEDLPINRIQEMLQNFEECRDNEKAKQALIELDETESLKKGIVANMIGVVSFLLERYKYNAFISIENLCRAFFAAKDGLTGQEISNTHQDPSMTFKEQENLVLAGLGTYHFFEMQLLRKLLKIQLDKEILHLVPTFRSVQNYEDIRKLTKKDDGQVEYVYKQFGIVHFVDPKYTSKKCPVCGTTQVTRSPQKNIDTITCNNNKCGYSTAKTDESQDIISNQGKKGLGLEYIKNGDDNGAYHIALKTLKNLNLQTKKRI